MMSHLLILHLKIKRCINEEKKKQIKRERAREGRRKKERERL